MRHKRGPLRHKTSAVGHSRRALRHWRAALRHARRSLRHSRPALRHSRQALRHWLPRLRHSLPALRHSRPALRHWRRALRHSRLALRHSLLSSSVSTAPVCVSTPGASVSMTLASVPNPVLCVSWDPACVSKALWNALSPGRSVSIHTAGRLRTTARDARRGWKKLSARLAPPAAPVFPIPPTLTAERTIAQFRALSCLLGHLDRAAAHREAVQKRRRRSDREILARFPPTSSRPILGMPSSSFSSAPALRPW